VLTGLCLTYFVFGFFSIVLLIIAGLIVRYRIVTRGGKAVEFDRNQFLLSGMIILAAVSLATFLVYVFLFLGKC